MSAEDHSVPDAQVGTAHDLAEEAEHARVHARENIWFFLGFFSLILCAVGSYELSANALWAILLLAAFRAALIAGFFVWLIGSFSFVVRTIVFTVIFFIGMVSLSIWAMVDPIHLPIHH